MQEVSAAVLSVNDAAAVSHQTAAVLWEMTDRRPERIDVVTARWDRVRRPGIAVHESRDLLPQDRVVLDGVAVTSPERTIVDLGAEAPFWLVESCLDTALRAKLFGAQDVRRLIARVARRGRRGVGKIRPLIEERLRWEGLTESELEDKFRRLVHLSGLPQPVAQFRVRDARGRFVCRADFAYPDRHLLIELDSEAFHMDRNTFQRDRDKQNRALALGWTTLRFTWSDLTKRPDQAIRLLADMCDP
jgi:very-short-patch-repair endonuclease